jgi:hypothetical protein
MGTEERQAKLQQRREREKTAANFVEQRQQHLTI